MRAWTTALSMFASAVLTACGGVQIAPEPIIPKALITQMPVSVGLVLSGDQRNYKHDETRAGVEWQIQLGNGHGRFARDVMTAMFKDSFVFEDLKAAGAQPGLSAIFEPRMEQYSFATANETGGQYYAVTIRYRVNVFAPDLQLVDSYTITGYGNSRDQSMSSSKPLEGATRAAMRDAAAKIMVQFPEQDLGKTLAKGESLRADTYRLAGTTTSSMQADIIEALPIVDTPKATPTQTVIPTPAPSDPAPSDPVPGDPVPGNPAPKIASSPLVAL